MALPKALPENYKILIIAPKAACNAMAYDVISFKHVHKGWFILEHQGENDTDLTVSLLEAKAVAGATATTTAVTAVFPVWENVDAGTPGDTLTKVATDAASYKIDIGDGGANQLIVIEWDPAKFSAGYDCIKMTDAGGHGSNTMSVIALLEMRYTAKSADIPSVIVD